jgi:Ser/Thr protein kinase RdoA (MazF antagonist)
VQAQNSLFGHLGFNGLRCPAAEPTMTDSRLIVSEQLAGGVSKLRLLKFVPGETLKASPKVRCNCCLSGAGWGVGCW